MQYDYTFREKIKIRWLYYLSLLLMYIAPLVIILVKTFSVKKVDSKVSIWVAGFILGALYLAFLSKKICEAISKMKLGPLKILASGVNGIVPFGIVACLVWLVEYMFDGFTPVLLIICGVMLIATIIQVIEYLINKEYISMLEIHELALKQVAIEKEANRLRGI
jgi:hypothetical protein